MAELFQKAKSTINEHIKNIYADGELSEASMKRKFGNFEFSTKPLNFCNLDMVIFEVFRVKSQLGVQFLLWAAARGAVTNLSDYFYANSRFNLEFA